MMDMKLKIETLNVPLVWSIFAIIKIALSWHSKESQAIGFIAIKASEIIGKYGIWHILSELSFEALEGNCFLDLHKVSRTGKWVFSPATLFAPSKQANH